MSVHIFDSFHIKCPIKVIIDTEKLDLFLQVNLVLSRQRNQWLEECALMMQLKTLQIDKKFRYIQSFLLVS